MTWFKVDDNLWTHPKFTALNMSARGLWVTAGSWSARMLTNGRITGSQIRALGGTQKQASDLVEAGLWSVACEDRVQIATRFSQREYIFHDWIEYQPTKEKVEYERERNRKKQTRFRRTESPLPAGTSKRNPVTAPVTTSVSNRVGNPQSNRGSNPQSNRGSNHGPVPEPIDTGGRSTTGTQRASAESPSDPELDDPVDAALAEAFPGWRPGQSRIPEDATPDQWCTADDPRCRAHASLPRDQVPRCGGCARVKDWFQDRERAAVQAHWSAIAGCGICDDLGFYTPPDGGPLIRCHHTGTPPSVTATDGHDQGCPKTGRNSPQSDETPAAGTDTPNRTAKPAKPPF